MTAAFHYGKQFHCGRQRRTSAKRFEQCVKRSVFQTEMLFNEWESLSKSARERERERERERLLEFCSFHSKRSSRARARVAMTLLDAERMSQRACSATDSLQSNSVSQWAESFWVSFWAGFRLKIHFEIQFNAALNSMPGEANVRLISVDFNNFSVYSSRLQTISITEWIIKWREQNGNNKVEEQSRSWHDQIRDASEQTN